VQTSELVAARKGGAWRCLRPSHRGHLPGIVNQDPTVTAAAFEYDADLDLDDQQVTEWWGRTSSDWEVGKTFWLTIDMLALVDRYVGQPHDHWLTRDHLVSDDDGIADDGRATGRKKTLA
jgi:hypothetical protein